MDFFVLHELPRIIMNASLILLFKFLKLYFTTDFTDFTDLGCASLLLFHRFFYDYSGQGRDWLRVANNLCNHIFESLNNLCNLELIAALPQKS